MTTLEQVLTDAYLSSCFYLEVEENGEWYEEAMSDTWLPLLEFRKGCWRIVNGKDELVLQGIENQLLDFPEPPESKQYVL